MNLQMYYAKRAAGGRSLFARVFDAVIFCAIVFCILFVIMFYYTFSIYTALIIAVLVTTSVSLALTLVKRSRLKKQRQKDLAELKNKCLLEELTFMEAEEFSNYINELLDGKLKSIEYTESGFKAEYEDSEIYVVHSHPGAELSVSEALNIYRSANKKNSLIILTTASVSDEAAEMLRRKEAKIIVGSDVLRRASQKDMLVSEQEAEKKAEELMKQSLVTLKQLKKNALGRLKIRGYILCGILALAWPLVGGFRIYYPIISIVCFALAVISYKKGSNAKENTDIGTT